MRLTSLVLITAASILLIASTCPSPDPFPPPPMNAPLIVSLEVTGIASSGTYQSAVRVQWNLLNIDSLPVKSFVLLKKSPSDSVFSILQIGIPKSISEFYDIIAQKDIPKNQLFGSPYSAALYRVFAIDTFDHSSDTSTADSVLLTWPASSTYPLDTLKQNLFTWSTQGYQGGYFASVMVWNYDHGLVWTSPKPSQPTYGSVSEDSFSIQLPANLYPLAPGKYAYGVKIDFPGVNMTTMSIRDFYAP